MPANPTNLLPAAVAVFLGWRVFRRVRKNIGRQPLQTKRMMIRIALYTSRFCSESLPPYLAAIKFSWAWRAASSSAGAWESAGCN